MPKVKDYTAKQELTLDCGHTVKAGETYHVTSVFTCARELRWPLNILMACFAVAKRKASRGTSQEKDTPHENQKPPEKKTADAS
jgi:hypothetical protein